MSRGSLAVARAFFCSGLVAFAPFAGCSASRSPSPTTVAGPQPSDAPSGSPASSASTSSIASATSASASAASATIRADGFPIGVGEVHRWSDGTSAGIVGDSTLFVLRPGSRVATRALDFSGGVTTSASIDLDGDGVDEWMLWTMFGPTAFSLRDGKLVELVRLPWMLDGAKDEAAVRARLPALHGYVAPAAGVLPRDILLSLQFATDEQVRALMDPKGVSVCSSRTGNARPLGRQCRTIRRGGWSTKEIFEVLFIDRAFNDYRDQPFVLRGRTDGRWALQPPTCTSTGDGASCVANDSGGPGNLIWEFRGTGAAMRLTSIESEAYEDS